MYPRRCGFRKLDIPFIKLILFAVSLSLSSLKDTSCVLKIYLPIKKLICKHLIQLHIHQPQSNTRSSKKTLNNVS